jgi:sugar porter (SP) family MFS transporter
MASRGDVVVANGEFKHYEGHTTIYVVLACLLASFSGLMLGYDIGITGGVAQMNDFLEKFFPVVVVNKELEYESGKGNLYCQYNNQHLQAYISSLYLVGFASTLVAAPITRLYGRKTSILIAGISFLIGVVLKTSAQNLAMLVLGRVLYGWGLGFSNQAAPLYMSEVAPFKWRGRLTYLFQLSLAIGAFCANVINYGTSRLVPNGWRISLGLAGIPAIIITISGIILSDTPNSLVHRGKQEAGRKVLERMRGITNVDIEFEDILIASNQKSSEERNAFKNVLKGKSIPPLIVSCIFQIFNQFTGINDLTFYSPVLFSTLGFKSGGALFTATVLTGLSIFSVLVGLSLIDKVGRKALLIEGNVQMFLSAVAIAIILRYGLQDEVRLSHPLAIILVVFVCLFVMGWAWSWGPCEWLIPSEIFPLETRSAGLSIGVSVNFLFSFVIVESFLSMLCSLKWGLFVFFAVWNFFMPFFVLLYVPETKGVPIEEMELVWRRHWFWKRFMPVDNYIDNSPEKP